MKTMQFFFFILLITTSNIFALEQSEDSKNKNIENFQSDTTDSNDDDSKDDKPKTIGSFIEENELDEIDGFMHLWVDKEKDDYFLQLNVSDLNNEFIYFTYILDAPQASGNFGGALSDGSILEFRKFKKDIGLYKKNTKFIYDETSNISQSKLRNIQEAFIGRFKVEVTEEETNNYLIKVNSLFLSEMLTAISPNIPPEYMEYIDLNVGKIDKTKTFIDKVKNYAKNTTVDVVYGFFNPRPKNNSVDAVADKRYTSGKVRHLFVEMPDNNFEPRLADQRVGYFSEKVTDLSSYNYFPAVDLINKWRLIKKTRRLRSQNLLLLLFIGLKTQLLMK